MKKAHVLGLTQMELECFFFILKCYLFELVVCGDYIPLVRQSVLVWRQGL